MTNLQNTVVINGGTIDVPVVGGNTASDSGTGIASRNTVKITGGTFTKDIVGGFAVHGDSSSGSSSGDGGTFSAEDNRVELYGVDLSNSAVYGGYAGNNGTSSGNTIALYAVNGKGSTIKAIGASSDGNSSVQKLDFYLDDTAIDSGDGGTVMLTVLGDADTPFDTDIRGVQISVQTELHKNSPALWADNQVVLLTVVNGNLLTDDTLDNVTGMSGTALDYEFALSNENSTNLTMKLASVKINPATKSLAETRAGTTSFINQGADFMADMAMAAAEQAVNYFDDEIVIDEADVAVPEAEAAAGPSAAARQQAGHAAKFVPWAAAQNSSLRAHSGSYVDTHGYSLGIGFAKKEQYKNSSLLHGPFISYGRGTYDSYLDDGTHGRGNMSYLGAGYMGKYTLPNNLYIDGMVQAGRAWSDYEGEIRQGNTSTYDSDNNFYAAQIGIGKVFSLSRTDKLDVYTRYLWSHQTGTTATLHTGSSEESYDFGAVNSHRLRIGTRWTQQASDRDFLYAGLAWEYEFSSAVHGRYAGYDLPSPGMRGGSGMLELGYRYQPLNRRNMSYDLNLTGWQGKREGITIGGQIYWGF